MKHIALTSAINYNDYLKIFKKHNYHFFDEIYVTTDENEDKQLEDICNDPKFKLIKITKNIGWCDDPNSEKYNQIINLPTKYGYEKLYRKDNIYDLILVLNYNMNPAIKNKGSAIFIHIANKKYQPTQGCIALKKDNLLKLISKINKNIKIKIN
jgi:L,D-peptidoglycan transpeptidase YkuD (ErfK/YbiS/YcfS/YnhG family)